MMNFGPRVAADCSPQVFIVRLWQEAAAPGQSGEWRGSVEHAATHEKRYFREAEALVDFIHRQLDGPAPATDPSADRR